MKTLQDWRDLIMKEGAHFDAPAYGPVARAVLLELSKCKTLAEEVEVISTVLYAVECQTTDPMGHPLAERRERIEP
jgi:hypothetical protein